MYTNFYLWPFSWIAIRLFFVFASIYNMRSVSARTEKLFQKRNLQPSYRWSTYTDRLAQWCVCCQNYYFILSIYAKTMYDAMREKWASKSWKMQKKKAHCARYLNVCFARCHEAVLSLVYNKMACERVETMARTCICEISNLLWLELGRTTKSNAGKSA